MPISQTSLPSAGISWWQYQPKTSSLVTEPGGVLAKRSMMAFQFCENFDVPAEDILGSRSSPIECLYRVEYRDGWGSPALMVTVAGRLARLKALAGVTHLR
jgi:hypothetical protein